MKKKIKLKNQIFFQESLQIKAFHVVIAVCQRVMPSGHLPRAVRTKNMESVAG